MPYIKRDEYFNPEDYDQPVIGIASQLNNHDSLMHQHQKAQLLYAPQGSMTIILDHQWLVLPPTLAAWIPANIPHRVKFYGFVEYRSLYFKNENNPNLMMLPQRPIIFAVTPLLRELIERLALLPFNYRAEKPRHSHAISLLYQEIIHAKRAELHLTSPNDPRLAPFIASLHDRYALPSLSELARSLSLHPKTLTRLFKRETGLSYQAWRQQWRLIRAIELLSSTNNQVSEVAQQLEFSSDSAFIAFFKKYMGETPLTFTQKIAR